MKSIATWRRRYQRLLGLYPTDYRRHYAEPILQLFDDLVRDAPPDAQHRVIRAAIIDTSLSIVREQAIALKHRFLNKDPRMSKKVPFYTRHRLALLGGILIVVLIIGGAIMGKTLMTAATTASRLAQINGIYNSLHLDKNYYLTRENVFGDKRLYDYDKGRSYSSERDYSRDAPVDATVADLRSKIEAAGYTFVDEPYPGAAQTQLHFRSKEGHYIRMTVSSLHRDSAYTTNDPAISAAYDATHSPNEGPSSIILKVNLDDNNE